MVRRKTGTRDTEDGDCYNVHSLRDLHRCGSRWLSKQVLELDVPPSVKNHLKTNNVALKELAVSDFIKNN